MIGQEAYAALERLTQANEEPTLSVEDLLDCLELSKVADASGLPPSDPNWVPTWDLARGAAEGWRRKAAKVATAYDAQADGAELRRSQMYDHCMRMSDAYRRKLLGYVKLTR